MLIYACYMNYSKCHNLCLLWLSIELVWSVFERMWKSPSSSAYSRTHTNIESRNWKLSSLSNWMYNQFHSIGKRCVAGFKHTTGRAQMIWPNKKIITKKRNNVMIRTHRNMNETDFSFSLLHSLLLSSFCGTDGSGDGGVKSKWKWTLIASVIFLTTQIH